MLIAAIRGTQGDLGTLLKGDFTGQANFIFWFVSILLIGAVGYIPKLKPFSVAFLVLVILVLFLSRGNPQTSSGGFFGKFVQALQSTTSVATSATSTAFTALPNLGNVLPNLTSVSA